MKTFTDHRNFDTESIRRASPGLQKWPNRQVQDPRATNSSRVIIERPSDPEKSTEESIQMGPGLQVLLYSRPVRLVLLHWFDSGVSRFTAHLFSMRYVTNTTSLSIGDFADAMMALWLVKKASKVDGGLPATLYAKMISNIVFDFAIGLIPIVGDLVDAVYRANTRNAWLLHVYLMAKAEAVRNGKVSDPETGETIHLTGHNSGHGVLQPSIRTSAAQSHAQPETSAPKATHGRGWGWNRGGGRTAEPDLESGIVEIRPEQELRDDRHGGRSDGRGGSTRDPRSQGGRR